MRAFLLLAFITFATMATKASSDVHMFPDGSATQWIVELPQEIVGYVLFDCSTVENRISPLLRFITVGELATKGIQWASDYLAEEPAHKDWGISFIEIVKMGIFTIDDHSPEWPINGAAALWMARVASSDSTVNLDPGLSLQVLEFWIPDIQYVTYMLKRGYYASYGDVTLQEDKNGTWRGRIDVEGLHAEAHCTPTGPIIGGAGSSGQQSLFPPRFSTETGVVRVSLNGHRIQDCNEESLWQFSGDHALANGILVGSSTYQFGYNLLGGVIFR
ncbi:MAG: hypothetical protein HQ510_00390 [Candidatus Marinimicrobia bacterium]|nr:hypothetical protein [Candidatus Neomarinimicrobiota bacterium]